MILQVALAGNLDKDKMIKKVFVFSDMEFDQASGGNGYSTYNYSMSESSDESSDSESESSDSDSEGGEQNTKEGKWNTDYRVIENKFTGNGYAVPEIVFWNLRDSNATPVTSDHKGVALVSGYSKNLMKLFIEEEEVPGPEAVMELALNGPEYIGGINCFV
ncbi:hypothetical protein IFM89_006559 [Coptis chinensis]|uniref:DUF7788 domain-containing protein n=1 Tax=Coptis chinensis TaxID=261450 RepID=A0A835M7K9_9MAGN|nr:hypothetical protein IFM89_006559 [Coptis chinensis]